MRRLRNVKVLATLGPSSGTAAKIRALFEAGADAFRLNMSHGSHKDVAALNAAIRKVEAEVGRPIAILVDLQGPTLRVGRMAAGTDLEPGRPFRLDLEDRKSDVEGKSVSVRVDLRGRRTIKQ